MTRIAYLIAALVVALSTGIAVWMVVQQSADRGVPGSGTALVGGPFTLTDQTGAPRSEQDFRGRLMLVYFGYTYCPDVCPTELQVMAEAVDLLGPQSDEVVPVFVTVDPARDTVQVLADYVPFFHDRLVGLTGAKDQVAAAAKAYRVYYAKADSGDGGAYLMDHTSLVYLMGREGEYLRHFTSGTTPQAMAEAMREAL